MNPIELKDPDSETIYQHNSNEGITLPPHPD